jgi:hypothetical protein
MGGSSLVLAPLGLGALGTDGQAVLGDTDIIPTRHFFTC